MTQSNMTVNLLEAKYSQMSQHQDDKNMQALELALKYELWHEKKGVLDF